MIRFPNTGLRFNSVLLTARDGKISTTYIYTYVRAHTHTHTHTEEGWLKNSSPGKVM